MWLVVSATPRPLYRWKRPGTNCVGVWVGLSVGLEGYGKSLLNGDSIPGLSRS
jgi:hypothetical protein